jgi:hypothetical protein
MNSPEMNSIPEEPKMDINHPLFDTAFEYINLMTGEHLTAPFDAAVSGMHNEFFGIGKVVGTIEGVPIIELKDTTDPEGEDYYLTGLETRWVAPVHEEIIKGINNGYLPISSVAEYKTYLDEQNAEQVSDSQFLKDIGIDPNEL